jgi:hypothetical protein
MSCSQTVPCDNPGCFAGCCGVQCPPDGLCKSITICYECYGTDAPEPCPCVSKYSNLLGFLVKRKPNEKNVNYMADTNQDLGIINLPEIPDFDLNKFKITIKENSVFAFDANCSIPCATICTTCVSGSKCGMTQGCEDYCDDCCCPSSGSVRCSVSGGGSCKVTVGWCGSINVGNPCCSCCEVSRDCYSGGSLWNKKELSSNKVKLVLNKTEFIKRINNMKKFRIARRRRKIR